MRRYLFVFFAHLLLCQVNPSGAANWAVLVAGSKGWSNYRHQADVCHAYQILHKNGIPDSNIIVMMYDDLAKNIENPTKGIVINHPNGEDVYHGVPHDYTGLEVTPQTFMDVLLGNTEALRGVGSGKVLQSGPNDNVFIYFTDHGAVGLVAFPRGVLYAKDLNATIAKMHAAQKYKQMVVYIEACESGSMLEGLLPDNINVYATTASNAEESSYACYYDAKRHTYLGDVYSVVWMEDSDAEKINQETLYQQYLITQAKTNTSHVMQYGDLNLGKSHFVSEFQGENSFAKHFKKLSMKKQRHDALRRDAVRSENVRLSIINHRLAAAKDSPLEKAFYQQQLQQLIHARTSIENHIGQIASTVLTADHVDQLEMIKTKHLKLTEHDCYRSITTRIAEKCFDLENEMVLHKLYIMANLCELGYGSSRINQAIDQVCTNRLDFDY